MRALISSVCCIDNRRAIGLSTKAGSPRIGIAVTVRMAHRLGHEMQRLAGMKAERLQGIGLQYLQHFAQSDSARLGGGAEMTV